MFSRRSSRKGAPAASGSTTTVQVEEMESVTSFRYDHVFKVVMVGECGVGKTTLAMRFAADSYRPEAPSTIGVDFSVRILQVDGKRIKVQLWDTSGQETMRCIVPNYFRFAEAIVVVYDSTCMSSFLKLPGWLELVRKFADPTSQVFIMATKCDRMLSRVVTPKMARDYAKSVNLHVYETSAMSGQGVETAFLAVVRAMEQHSGAPMRSTFMLRGTGPDAAAPSRRPNCC